MSFQHEQSFISSHLIAQEKIWQSLTSLIRIIFNLFELEISQYKNFATRMTMNLAHD
jgi:hypothetical protein